MCSEILGDYPVEHSDIQVFRCCNMIEIKTIILLSTYCIKWKIHCFSTLLSSFPNINNDIVVGKIKGMADLGHAFSYENVGQTIDFIQEVVV